MALTDNLVSYWKLDESSGNAADSVGSNTGVNTSVTYSAGKINNGGAFNGSSSFLNCGSSINLRDNFSISMWAKSNTSLGTLISRELSGSNYPQFAIFVGSYKASLEVFSSNSASPTANIFTTSSLSATYSMITVTRDGTNVKIYFNGILEATAAWTLQQKTSTDAITIGRNSTSGSRYLDGNADEVGIWDRALSASEITELYNGGAGLTYPFTTANQANFLAFF